MGQLDDELALFVLLAALEGVFLQSTAQEKPEVSFQMKEKNIVSIFDKIKAVVHSEQRTNSDLKTLKKYYNKYNLSLSQYL